MKFINDKSAYLDYIYKNCHCVNAGRSQEDRRAIYGLLRKMGMDYKTARIIRDRRYNNIAKYCGYSDWDTMIKCLTLP